MRQLVVLVGPAGSGKTTFRDRHPEWAIVCKDDIRRGVFHRDFDATYEDTVSKIFAAVLIEAVESPADVVCVDSTNLTRAERSPLIEVAQACGRSPVAYVMPLAPLEDLYQRKLQQLSELASQNPQIVVGGFPKERYARMFDSYEAVTAGEGFDRVVYEVPVARTQSETKARKPRRARRKAINQLKPLPLFGQ